ncbi:MAG: tyrosine-type recombinase/integrase [Proteobacteria bacterium]|nr:tyrosine-type recombinase/integrase [Pseudomonadota bacterium]
MSVRQDANLTTEQIKSVVKRQTNPFDEEFDAYIASVPHGRPMPPEQEPAHQALLMDAAKAVLRSALVENDIDPLVRNIAAHLPVSSTVDDLTLRRLAREILTQRVEQLNVQGNTLNEMANARPISPPAVEPKNPVTVEFEVDRDTYDRLTQERLTAKVGDVSPLHEHLTRRVNEEIAAGRTIPDHQHNSPQTPVREVVSPMLVPEQPTDVGPTLSKMWPLLSDELVLNGEWTPKVRIQSQATLKLMLGVCGDKPLALYTVPELRSLRHVVLRLPSTYSKSPEWRDRCDAGQFVCIAEAADASVSADGPAIARVKPKTWNRHLSCVNRIWKAAREHGWTPTRLSPFNELHLDQKSGKAALRAKASSYLNFDESDLEAIFRLPVFTGHGSGPSDINRPGPFVYADHRYWGILVGAYTGMREGEVAQLRCRHVRQAPSGGYFLALDASEGSLDFKEVGSERIVPIHSDLIRLGLIELCVKGRNPNHFLISTKPLAKAASDQGSQAQALGISVGRFFNRTVKVHLKLDDRKVFHSFRHTVTTLLIRGGVAPDHVSEIIGHADGNRPKVTQGYFHGLTLAELTPAIEKLKLPIDIDRLLDARRLSAIVSKSGGGNDD